MRLLSGMTVLLLSACVSEPTTSCHCPEPVFIESVPEANKKSSLPVAPAREKNNDRTAAFIVGTVEFIEIQPAHLRLRARIDSGAETSALHARHIEIFESQGQRWVRFETGNALEMARLELPLIRMAKIKAEGDSVESRPVVILEVRLGARVRRVEMTLSDRSHYDFAVLIGRNFLGSDTLIDTGRTYVQGE